jgi:hypothetical protein
MGVALALRRLHREEYGGADEALAGLATRSGSQCQWRLANMTVWNHLLALSKGVAIRNEAHPKNCEAVPGIRVSNSGSPIRSRWPGDRSSIPKESTYRCVSV